MLDSSSNDSKSFNSSTSATTCSPNTSQLNNPTGISLVEIITLSAFFGSETAEQLMLGNRGAAGKESVSSMCVFNLTPSDRLGLGRHEHVRLALVLASVRGSRDPRLVARDTGHAQCNT